MKKLICKGCQKEFIKEGIHYQLYCTKKCCYDFNKKNARVDFKKRYSIEIASKTKPLKVDKLIKKEIFDFLDEIKYKKSLYLTPIDSFRLIHYYVELYGVWVFKDITIEEELYFCYKKCHEWMTKERCL